MCNEFNNEISPSVSLYLSVSLSSLFSIFSNLTHFPLPSLFYCILNLVSQKQASKIDFNNTEVSFTFYLLLPLIFNQASASGRRRQYGASGWWRCVVSGRQQTARVGRENFWGGRGGECRTEVASTIKDLKMFYSEIFKKKKKGLN